MSHGPGSDSPGGPPVDGAAGRPVDRDATAALLARYDRPGPRYTSYPTAVEFDGGVDAPRYAELLAGANAAVDEPLSIYVHLPFCVQRCLFCGCHVIASLQRDRMESYLTLLKREIDLVAEHLPQRRTLSQLHLGGGTPTSHPPADLDALLRYLFERFEPTPGAEVAVEVDPRVTTDEHLKTLASHGFNRISVGVQDLDPQVQDAIGRTQPYEETARLIETARGLGFAGVNVDLIYGLPHQQQESFERTVDRLIDLGIDRAAVYSFAYVPWIRGHQKKLDEAALPDRNLKFGLFATARERFLSAGFEPIGMDHFALPSDELSIARREGRLRRNFQGYSVIPASDVLGLGVSAIGDVRGAYVQNVKKLSGYELEIEAGRLPVERGVERNEDDEIRRHVIHELMCNFRVDVHAVEARYSIDFDRYFAEDLGELAGHEVEGLVRTTQATIEVTPVGELFIRNLAMCFDRYWREKHRDSQDSIFSRTV